MITQANAHFVCKEHCITLKAVCCIKEIMASLHVVQKQSENFVFPGLI